MKRTRLILRQWTREYGPAILPVLATMAIALTVAYYATEQGGGQPSPGWWGKYFSWLWHIPEWLTRGLLMVLLAGSLAFIAGQTALKYRIGANAAAVSGVATTATLTWATRSCDLTGGMTTGLAVAGVIMAGAVGVRALKEKRLQKALEDWWSSPVSEQTTIGTAQFAQISLALYMGTVALMAIVNALPAESRWDVLAFSGIGITAASTISEQGKLKNFLAVVGSGIALLGSYVEMDRALAIDGNETTATTVLLVAGLVIYVPFTVLVLRAGHWVRILIAPMLIAGMAICATFVATSVPAILVYAGCNLKPTLIVVLIGVSGLISGLVGVAAFCIAVALTVRSWRKEARAATKKVNE